MWTSFGLEQAVSVIKGTRKLWNPCRISGKLEFKERGSLRRKFRQSSFSTQPAFANPGLRPSQRRSQIRDALEHYSVFSEGARTDGLDFTPADWGAELPLQDIPWSHSTSMMMGVLARSSFRLFHPHFTHSACALGMHPLSSSRD
jgi:hypothetical protein